jgi:hypothetical protein
MVNVLALGAGTATAVSATPARTPTGAVGARSAKHLAADPVRDRTPVASPVSTSTDVSTSTNWSGYVAYDTNFDSVSATWVEPAVTCPKKDAWTLFWVGLDGWNETGAERTVEQGGTSAKCAKGSPTYTAFWEMWPSNAAQLSFPVSPGDDITAGVVYSPSTQQFVITVTDDTTGGSLSETASCGTGLECARLSAEWIAESPSVFGTNRYYALADYGTMTFTKAKVTDQEGMAGAISGGENGDEWNYSGIERVLSVKSSKAKVSPLQTSGTSFSDTFKHG